MGSSSLFDIIGSFFVGGMLLIMGLRLNAQATEVNATFHMNLTLQQNMVNIVDIIETDFRKIGWSANPDTTANQTLSIIKAESTGLKFRTDINKDGSLDSLYWYAGPPSEMASTTNPNDRYLYRKINQQAPFRMNVGCTKFWFKYFNAIGDSVTLAQVAATPSLIYSMELTINLETPDPYIQQYNPDPYAYEMVWRQLRLVSRNLKNR
jgi:hypothetical protein